YGISDKYGSICDSYVGRWSTIRGLAIILSFLVMGSPYAGAVAVSVFVGIALLIIGIETTVVGITGRKVPMMSSDIRR
ncbi:MAG TPA: hypothetical protein VH500_08135, partial [Nitrososphaeraceae archaeon]